MLPEISRPYIIDADVLIDYYKTYLSVLSLFAQLVSACYVGRSTLGEVEHLSISQAEKHHLIIKTPDIGIAEESARRKGVLSFQDWETYLMANKFNLICISNDKNLRSECKGNGVSVLWGLEPMKLLVGHKVLTKSRAIQVAEQIQASNPHYIKPEILVRFGQQLDVIVADLNK